MLRDRIYTKTGDLLNIIRNAQTPEEAIAWHDAGKDLVFSDTLYDMLQEHHISPREMILASGIDRSYFYHILSGIKIPGRNMVLRIGFCLRATYNEMNLLLSLSGCGILYPKIRRDSILIFALEHQYTMSRVNELLSESGELPLYTTGKK